MKCIEAVIMPESLDNVRHRLTDIAVEGLMVPEAIGFGHPRGHTSFYRGCEERIDFHPELLVTVIAFEDQAPEILDAIVQGARTGEVGDGKIFVTTIEEVVRIRTGESNRAA